MKRYHKYDRLDVTLPDSQATRIITKFGGPIDLAKLLECAPSTVYRWTYAVSEGGTGGNIPPRPLSRIIALARIHGVHLTKDDVYPGRALT